MRINISVQMGDTINVRSEVESIEEADRILGWASSVEDRVIRKGAVPADFAGGARPVETSDEPPPPPAKKRKATAPNPPVEGSVPVAANPTPAPVIDMVKDEATGDYSRKTVSTKIVEMASANPTKLKAVLVEFGGKLGVADPDKFKFRDVPDDKLQEFMEACAA